MLHHKVGSFLIPCLRFERALPLGIQVEDLHMLLLQDLTERIVHGSAQLNHVDLSDPGELAT